MMSVFFLAFGGTSLICAALWLISENSSLEKQFSEMLSRVWKIWKKKYNFCPDRAFTGSASASSPSLLLTECWDGWLQSRRTWTWQWWLARWCPAWGASVHGHRRAYRNGVWYGGGSPTHRFGGAGGGCKEIKAKGRKRRCLRVSEIRKCSNNLLNIGQITVHVSFSGGRILWSLFYFIKKNYWSIVDFQCRVHFRCTAEWFSYIYTHIQVFSRCLFHIGYYRILSRVPCALQ